MGYVFSHFAFSGDGSGSRTRMSFLMSSILAVSLPASLLTVRFTRYVPGVE